MTSLTIRGTAAVLLLFAFASASWAYTDKTVRWTEDALLHDGKTVLVEREIQETLEVRLTDPFFGLFPAPRTERGGDIHSLKFKHPDTGATVKWQGQEEDLPMLLGFVDGVAYLVVYARPSKKHEQALGCPDLPYAFLEFDASKRSRWIPIPVDKAPVDLRVANLAGGFNYKAEALRELKPGELKHQAASFVQDFLQGYEVRSRKHFQREIPRTYENWRYPDKDKDEYRNMRILDDCRPPPRPLPDIVLPGPIDVDLDAVETTDGTSSEHRKMLLSKPATATRDKCNALFTRADPANSMAGERFVSDPTRTKRPPYSGPAPIALYGFGLGGRAPRYCDANFIWYVAEHEERGKIWITKYTSSGELLYNARVARPQTADNTLARKFVIDSTTGEGGYFYFYWDQSLPSPSSGPFTSRLTQFRFREPRQALATN